MLGIGPGESVRSLRMKAGKGGVGRGVGSSIHSASSPASCTPNSSHLEVFPIRQPGSERPLNNVTLNKAGDDIRSVPTIRKIEPHTN